MDRDRNFWDECERHPGLAFGFFVALAAATLVFRWWWVTNGPLAELAEISQLARSSPSGLGWDPFQWVALGLASTGLFGWLFSRQSN